MATREIKTTLKLEGEQEYKKAMRDAANSIKVLNSEQKLAAAQFEATGNKEQYLADKTDILKRKITEQQKSVKAAQEAVTKLKEKGVDPTNKAYQEWMTKLNTSKAYLTTLQSQLNATERELDEQGEAFDKAGDAAADYGEQLHGIGGGINFQNTIQSLESIQGKLNGALSVVESVIQGIWDAEMKAASWADSVLTEAQKAQIDVETYQSWLYAAQFIDTQVDDIIKSEDKLLKAMQSNADDVAISFNTLGVETRKSNGELRDTDDVFWDVIDALGKATDAHGNLMSETDKDALAQELFGKSYRELLPLINAGSEAWDGYVEEGRKFATVSEDDVAALGKLDDAHNALNSRMEATKNTLLAQLAPAFTDAAQEASKMIDAFNAWTQTEEGKDAIGALSEAVSGLLDEFIGNDFDGIVRGAAKAIETLTDVLVWIKDHGWAIVNTLVAMKIAVGGIEVTKTFLEMLQLMKSIKWLNMAQGAKSLGEAAAGKGVSEAAKAAGTGGIGAVIKGAATTAAPYAAFVAGVAFLGDIIDKLGTERDFGDYNRTVEKLDEAMEKSEDAKIAAAQAMLSAYQDALLEENEYGAFDPENIKKVFKETANQILQEYPELDFWSYVVDSVDTSDGLSDEEIDKILDLDYLSGMSWYEFGTDVVTGLIKGINDQKKAARDAAKETADSVTQTIEDEWAINSPSRVMAALGEYAADGLAQGLLAGSGKVVAAAQLLVGQVQSILASGYTMGGLVGVGGSGYGGGYGRAMPYAGMINANIIMDKKIVGTMTAPAVSGYMAAEVRASGDR